MPSSLERIALIDIDTETESRDEPSTTATPPSAAPKTASKGPPPLPTFPAPVPAPREGNPAEERLFEEGVDGRAESVPSSERDDLALDGVLLAADEEVEDPARTRRRRAARVGVAWGAVAMLTLAAVAAFIRPRTDERSAALYATPARVETAANAPAVPPSVVAPPSHVPGALPAAMAPARSPVRATTAALASAHPASPRAVVRKGSRSSPATRSASKPTSPRASGARAKRAVTASAARPARR